MKRILSALFIASALICAGAQAKETKEPKETEKTKYICSIGLEGEGVFNEEYETKEDCKRYCKAGIGGAVCEETGASTDVGETEVD